MLGLRCRNGALGVLVKRPTGRDSGGVRKGVETGQDGRQSQEKPSDRPQPPWRRGPLSLCGKAAEAQ